MSWMIAQTSLLVALVALSLCGVGPTEGIHSLEAQSLHETHASFLREAMLHVRGGGDRQDRHSFLSREDRCRCDSIRKCRKAIGAAKNSETLRCLSKLNVRLRGGAAYPRREPEWERDRDETQWSYEEGGGWGPEMLGALYPEERGASWMQAILVSDPAAHRVAAVLSNCFFYSHESFLATVSTLAFLIGNAARDPSDLAWRRVRRSNTALWERLGEDGFHILQACGYRQEYNGNELLYSLDSVDTRALSAAEKVLLAARDYGLHWLRSELAEAQRQATTRRRRVAGLDGDGRNGVDSGRDGRLRERLSVACVATHALLSVSGVDVVDLASSLEREFGMRREREFPPRASRAAGAGAWSQVLVLQEEGGGAALQVEIAAQRGQAWGRAAGRFGEEEEWAEEEAGAFDGRDHVLVESTEMLEGLRERGFEPDAHEELRLRGPGGCLLRVARGRGGGSTGWLALAVKDLHRARQFWCGLLGMREAERRRAGVVRLAFGEPGGGEGGWGVELRAGERGRGEGRRGGKGVARVGVGVGCPRELIAEVREAAEGRGGEGGAVEGPRRGRLFGGEEALQLEMEDPEGRRVLLADLEACRAAPARSAAGGDWERGEREVEERVEGGDARGRRGEGGGARLEARFLEAKEKELGRLEAMVEGAGSRRGGLGEAAAGLEKVVQGVWAWVRGGRRRGDGEREELEVLRELSEVLARDVVGQRKAEEEWRQRKAEAESEVRGGGRRVRAAEERVEAAAERAGRAEKVREEAERELEAAKRGLEAEFSRVMEGLRPEGEGALESVHRGTRREAGGREEGMARATLKCDKASAAVGKAAKGAEEAQRGLERAEAQLRAERERGVGAEEAAAKAEEGGLLLEGEREGLLVAVREAVGRVRGLLEQMRGGEGGDGGGGRAPERGVERRGESGLGRNGQEARGEGGGGAILTALKGAPAWARALQEQIQGSVGELSRVVEGLAAETKEIRAHVGLVEGQVSGAMSPGGTAGRRSGAGAGEAELRAAEDKYALLMEKQRREREESAQQLREAEGRAREAEGKAARLAREVEVLRRRRGKSVGHEEMLLREKVGEVEAQLREAQLNRTAAEAKLEEVRDWVSERWPFMQASPSSSPVPPSLHPHSMPRGAMHSPTLPSGLGRGADHSTFRMHTPVPPTPRTPVAPRTPRSGNPQLSSRGAAPGGRGGLEAARASRHRLEELLSQARRQGGEEEEGAEAQARLPSPATPKEESASEWDEAGGAYGAYGGGAEELLRVDDHTVGAAAVRLQPGDDILEPGQAPATVVTRLEAPRSASGRVHLRAGQYRVGGPVTVEGPLGLTGEAGAVVLGRWSLQDRARGEFSGVKLVNVAGGFQGDGKADATPPTLRAWMQPCMLAWAGPWTLDHCELRSSGGVALRCFKDGDVTLIDSGVGGLGPGADLASIAISLQERARCEVIRCTVEKTIPTGGGGVRCRDHSVSRVIDSVIHMHAHGISCSGAAVVEVQGCHFVDNRNAAVFIMEDAAEARVEIRGNTAWGGDFLVRSSEPQLLVEQDNRLLPPR